VAAESGALNFDKCYYVQEDHRRNDIRIVKPGVRVEFHGGMKYPGIGNENEGAHSAHCIINGKAWTP
jgi:hypothetical protein